MSTISRYRKMRKKVVRFPLYIHLKKDFLTRGNVFTPTWERYLLMVRRQMRARHRLVRETRFWKHIHETCTTRVIVTTWLSGKDAPTPYLCPQCGAMQKKDAPPNLRYETVMFQESETVPSRAFEFVLRCYTCHVEIKQEQRWMKKMADGGFPQDLEMRRLKWNLHNEHAVYHLSYRVSFSTMDSYMHHEERYRETHELHWEKATLLTDDEIVTDRRVKCVSEVAIEGYILEPTHPLYETVMNIINAREFPQA